MKRVHISNVAILCLWTLASCFAVDRSYWEGTDMALHGWRLPSPAARGPFWGGANGVLAGRMFETRKQLLFAINVWVKKYHQPELTMDDLIVRLAGREDFRDPDPRLEELVEYIVKNKRFELPIDLWMDEQNEIILSERPSSNERLPLPAHYTLAIRVLNVPWGSTDSDGISLKITLWSCPMAYALEAKKERARPPKHHSRPRPSIG